MAQSARSITPTGNRVFIGKLSGTQVFDPVGDVVGRISDVVVTIRFTGNPQVVGLIVEVSTTRRVFVPITRVTAIQPGQVITTGLVNIRRFQKRLGETTVMGELMDRVLTMRDGSGQVKILDVAMEQNSLRDWTINQLYVQRVASALSWVRGETMLVSPAQVTPLHKSILPQEATTLLAQLEDAKPADVADILNDLPLKRRMEVVSQIPNERLADVLEEMGEDDQVKIVSQLDLKRAGDVLDSMQPDDAADLIGLLPDEQAQLLLSHMEPEEAEDIRRLMAYDERTAGGMMTPTPVVLAPDANVALLLAHVRRQDIPPALAAIVFVVRPPTETPTGRFLGVVHLQRALREPPQTLIGQLLDKDIQTVAPDDGIGAVTRVLATYNLTAVPVVDEDRRLLGAVSVDDVLDHLLPEDWREADEAITDQTIDEFAEGNGE